MAYEKHEWEANEIITASKMNNIETGISNASIGDKNITLYKKSESIVISYERTENSLQLNFVGTTIDYNGIGVHSTGGGLTIPSASVTWTNGAFLVLNLVASPSIMVVNTLDEIYENDTYYIIGHMHYVNSIEAAYINGYGTLVAPTETE